MAVQTETPLELFKALANATRYAIFQRLMMGTQCNCELSKGMGISLSLVSHHLHALMRLGLVEARRDVQDARWIYFSIVPEVLEHYRQAFLQMTDPLQIQERLPACGPESVSACTLKTSMDTKELSA